MYTLFLGPLLATRSILASASLRNVRGFVEQCMRHNGQALIYWCRVAQGHKLVSCIWYPGTWYELTEYVSNPTNVTA